MYDPENPPVEINEHTPLSECPPTEILIECGNASYGMGNNFQINWDIFYESLESEGWDMQNLGGRMDNKIRRIVRDAVWEGLVS